MILLNACQLDIPASGSISLCSQDNSCPVGYQCNTDTGECDPIVRKNLEVNLSKPQIVVPDISLDLKGCNFNISEFVIPYLSNHFPLEPKLICVESHLFVFSAQLFANDFEEITSENMIFNAFKQSFKTNQGAEPRKNHQLYYYYESDAEFTDISFIFDDLDIENQIDPDRDVQHIDVRAVDDKNNEYSDHFLIFLASKNPRADKTRPIHNLDYIHIHKDKNNGIFKRLNQNKISDSLYGNYQINHNQIFYLEKNTNVDKVPTIANYGSFSLNAIDPQSFEISFEPSQNPCGIVKNTENEELPNLNHINLIHFGDDLLYSFLYEDDQNDPSNLENPVKIISTDSLCSEFTSIESSDATFDNRFKNRVLKSGELFLIAYSSMNNRRDKYIEYEIFKPKSILLRQFSRTKINLSATDDEINKVINTRLWAYGDSIFIPYQNNFNQELLRVIIPNDSTEQSMSVEIDPTNNDINLQTSQIIEEKTLSHLIFYPPNAIDISKSNQGLVTEIGFLQNTSSSQSYWVFNFINFK